MRLLYLTNGFPFPLTSGYLRHFFLLRELSRDHAITLLSIVAPSFREEHVAAVEPFTEHLETFPSSSKGQSLPRKVLNRVFGIDPAVRRMSVAVERLARERSFDVVFCGKKTLGAVGSLRGTPLIADMCDATSARIRRSLPFAGPGRLPLLWLEYAQTVALEKRMMRDAAHSVFITSRDREALGAPAEGTTIMPNGVDVDFWRRTVPERGADTIAFTGAMNYRPNTDAALHLIEEILPRVRVSVPGAHLSIVGRDPTPRLVAAGEADGVEVTGFVDDVRPYLERATVFAAPLRFGAGIQNKVLEAMAMELPVVASTLAADGLRTEEGDVPPMAIADDPDAFAAAIVRALEAGRVEASPVAEVRAFVERHFVWSASAAKLDTVLRTLAPRLEETCSP